MNQVPYMVLQLIHMSEIFSTKLLNIRYINSTESILIDKGQKNFSAVGSTIGREDNVISFQCVLKRGYICTSFGVVCHFNYHILCFNLLP